MIPDIHETYQVVIAGTSVRCGHLHQEIHNAFSCRKGLVLPCPGLNNNKWSGYPVKNIRISQLVAGEWKLVPETEEEIFHDLGLVK